MTLTREEKTLINEIVADIFLHLVDDAKEHNPEISMEDFSNTCYMIGLTLGVLVQQQSSYVGEKLISFAKTLSEQQVENLNHDAALLISELI